MSESRTASWISDGDSYPRPSDLSYKVTLYECQDCGRRAANPPGGNWTCVCGGETISQEYTPTQYSELRKYGEVRTVDE